MIEIRHYITESGVDVFGEWLLNLSDERAKARISARITRLVAGNYGDWKALQNGVCELRVDYGPGYRVYFARISNEIVLLLCGGDKRRQTADLKKAIAYWKQYQESEP